MAKLNDLSGQKFNKLTVISRATNDGTRARWNCICDCGKKKVLRGNSISSGRTKSCGCILGSHVGSHGHSMRAIYRTWSSMKQRCLNRNNSSYLRYGARGITVCDRWLNSFENFYADMGERPAGLSLDRIDNNGNYEPDNCKWSTVKEQASNTRYNVFITMNGVRNTFSEWSRITGVPLTTIHDRLKRGLSPEEILHNHLNSPLVNSIPSPDIDQFPTPPSPESIEVTL